MRKALLFLPAMAIDCSNSDTICLENTIVSLNQPISVFIAATQIPIPQPQMELRLYTGDLSFNAPVDPCSIDQQPAATFPVSTLSVVNTYMSSTTITFGENVRGFIGQRVFLQLWTNAGNCQLGPRTPGNNETFFQLVSDPTAIPPVNTGSSPSATNSATPTTTGTVDVTVPNSSNPDQKILWIVIGASIFLLLLLAFAAFFYFQRQKTDSVKRESRTSLDMLMDTESAFSSLSRPTVANAPVVILPTEEVQDPQGAELKRTSRIVSKPTFASTMSRKDAVAIGEAFKDALANPEWDRKSEDSL